MFHGFQHTRETHQKPREKQAKAKNVQRTHRGQEAASPWAPTVHSRSGFWKCDLAEDRRPARPDFRFAVSFLFSLLYAASIG